MRKFFVILTFASLAGVIGCGGSGNSTPAGVPGGGTGTNAANVLPVAVDGGPTANSLNGAIYPNGLFASATICAPGSTSNCVTVDHLLVDTGSFGLRVLQSAIGSLTLPPVNASNGSPAYDCVSFVDGSFLWGAVQSADVTLGGEIASSVPIQVIADPSGFSIPSSCSNGGNNEDTQATLGTNGILGIGLEPVDCGAACDPSVGGNPPTPAYYTCSGGTCGAAFVAEAQQVTNPVVLFSADNNGDIVELPSVSSAAPTLTGSLIFGIGTETNNQLPSSSTIFTLDQSDFFTTSYKGQSLTSSFIDSGSNALFFQDSSIPTCPTIPINLTSFYCPSSLLSLSATNSDPNTGSTKVTNFSVDNAENLFGNNSTDAAFSTLAGPNTGMSGSFDWGLPFFYGVNVYNAIDGQSVPSGAPAAPWWAY